MNEVWGVTYFIDGSDEGISVIELFSSKDVAEEFRNQYNGRSDRRYGVTRFTILAGVVGNQP